MQSSLPARKSCRCKVLRRVWHAACAPRGHKWHGNRRRGAREYSRKKSLDLVAAALARRPGTARVSLPDRNLWRPLKTPSQNL